MKTTAYHTRAVSRLYTLRAHILPQKNPENDTVDMSTVSGGWIGAKLQQLKRYEEWYYNYRENNEVIKFVVEPRELVCYELEGEPDRRMSELGNHVTLWLSERRKKMVDMNGACFFTFLVTLVGLCIYGTILEDLRSMHKLMEIED
ncbi:hypothetical protein Q3G72_001467 [Acer saccharum]|nr:hypothetical protein Q3G72_001467 [Acer saccharum]